MSGALRLSLFVAVLVLAAGLFTLLITDIDAFEEETGFFDRAGTILFNVGLGVIACLGALIAASFFFPAKWGPKVSWPGALFGAFIALWLGYVLAQGGV